MPNYQLSKIVSLGVNNHAVNDPDTFLLSSANKTVPSILANITRKYKKSLTGNSLVRPFYNIITKVGVANLTIKLIEERPLLEKNELNSFLEEIRSRTTKTTEQIIETVKGKTISEITMKRYGDNAKTLMKRMDTTDPLFYKNFTEVSNFIRSSDWAIET